MNTEDPRLRDALIELSKLRERDLRMRRASDVLAMALQELAAQEDWRMAPILLMHHLGRALGQTDLMVHFLDGRDPAILGQAVSEPFRGLADKTGLFEYLGRRTLRAVADPGSLPVAAVGSVASLEAYAALLSARIDVLDRQALLLCAATDRALLSAENRTLFDRFRALFTQALRRWEEGRRAEVLARNTEYARQLENLGEGLCVVDRDGLCEFMNPEGARLLGIVQQQALQRPFGDFIASGQDDTQRRGAGIVDAAIQSARPMRCDDRYMSRSGGSRFPVSMSIVPILDGSSQKGAVIVFRDIQDIKQRERELLRAREEAEQANMAKSQFLSNMSHELRTPLNGILGFAQVLRNGRKEPLSERQAGMVDQITQSGQHLLNLLNDILVLARIEVGRFTFSMEPVDSRRLLEDGLLLAKTLSAPMGLRIRLDEQTKAGVPWVMADYTRAKQVLINLLSNAIKYNRPDGEVVISALRSRDRLRISVADTGIGIPAGRHAELFKPFSRLGHESSGIEGTGIGLAISRQLVERMQGEIGFSSNPGAGSVFWFELPLSDPGTAAGRDVAVSQASTGEQVDPQTHVVLYIEDNPANLALMQTVLEDDARFVLVSAASAEEGLAKAFAVPPDLVLMDINLPGMNGYQALKALRAEPRTADLPVIALSADAMPESVAQGQAAGFTEYLTKPIDIDVLMAALHRATGAAVGGDV